MKIMIRALAVACALAAFSEACLHKPRAYPGELGSAIQEYLYYRSGSEIHLVMNQRVRASGPLPEEMAWVTPLPSVPSRYFVEEDSLFRKLFRATELQLKSLSLGAPRGAPPAGFKVHDTVHAGNYAIVPIEVLDPSSGKDINGWFMENGYDTVPYHAMKHYLRPKSCFLAIKVRGLRGTESQLHPLHVAYAAPEVRVPLRFFANAGTFDVYVYLLTRSERRIRQKGLAAAGFIRTGGGPLGAEFGKLAGLAGPAAGPDFIERYSGFKLNQPGNGLAAWDEDPLILLGPP